MGLGIGIDGGLRFGGGASIVGSPGKRFLREGFRRRDGTLVIRPNLDGDERSDLGFGTFIGDIFPSF